MFRKLHCTIVGRMLLYVVLPTVIIFAAIVALAAWGGFQNLRRASDDHLHAEVSLMALEIDDDLNNAVISARRMAEAQVAGMFGDRKASLDYARTVLEGYDAITASYFGYEPNADGKDAESVNQLPAEAMDESGRFIPYWKVTPGEGRTLQLEPLVDMDGLYYQGLKDAFESTREASPMVTEPYLYSGKMILEQTYPIIIDGNFVGVAGVDFALADIEAQLRQFASRENVDLFLISSRGKFIASTTDPTETTNGQGRLQTQAVADTEYEQLFGDLIKPRSQWIPTRATDPVDQESYFFISAPIPTGGWTLILRQSEREIRATIWGQLRSRVLLVFFGLAVIVGLLVVMTLRLSRRINLAAQTADRVAQGNLTEEIEEVQCQDETGVLLRAIKKMNDNLNTLVGQVMQASIELNSTATELAATSRQQESTASSFGASANEIAAATKQISATSAELVQTMDEVNQVATGTAELATSGQSGLQNMETNMRGLEQATTSVGEKLAVINEKASNITGIVTTITKVADQTNLLSVNAAIEAEKAGEYGVGFLVVAREIRRLADQTAAATLDIDQMVQQMQSAVSAGVMEMDRFTDQVRRSVKDVAEISTQMEEIIGRVNANTERFERVNESMQSQSQGADQISDAMGQLTSHATQTAEAIREYARASDELQTSIEALKSSIASFRLRT